MDEAFNAFQDDDDQWVAILTGGGRQGVLRGQRPEVPGRAWPERVRELRRGLRGRLRRLTRRTDCYKPIIAAVNGFALGGGFELVLSCDIIVAAEHATFGLPEPRVGLMASAGGVHRLPRYIPYHAAMGVILAGKRLSAAEAHAYGLVNEVVAGDALMAAARRWSDEILKGAPLSVRASKESTPPRDGHAARTRARRGLSHRTAPVRIGGSRRGPPRVLGESVRRAGRGGEPVPGQPEPARDRCTDRLPGTTNRLDGCRSETAGRAVPATVPCLESAGIPQTGAITMSEGIVFIDGEYMPPKDARMSIFDIGFVWGDSVYDVTLHLERPVLHARRAPRTVPAVMRGVPPREPLPVRGDAPDLRGMRPSGRTLERLREDADHPRGARSRGLGSAQPDTERGGLRHPLRMDMGRGQVPPRCGPLRERRRARVVERESTSASRTTTAPTSCRPASRHTTTDATTPS